MERPETILVPVDFSDHARAAVLRASGLAQACGMGVRLLHVSTASSGFIDPDLPDSLCRELRAKEQRRFETCAADWPIPDVPVSIGAVDGDPAEAIRRAAREPDVKLIVMGSHGRRGLDRLVLGSVAERTVQTTPVPVLVVRSSPEVAARPLRSILFATDFSPEAEHVEQRIAGWARALQAEVEVFHAIRETAVLFAPYAVIGSSDFEGELLEAASLRIRKAVERLSVAGVSAKSRIEYGTASVRVLERAEASGADLIAMGSHGYAGWQRLLLGSTALPVLRQAPCDVLIGGPPPRSRPWL